MPLTQKLYDLSVYLPYVSSLFANMGTILGIILYKAMFNKNKPYLQAEESMIFIPPLVFVLGCYIMSLICIDVYGIFALIKWFGILGL